MLVETFVKRLDADTKYKLFMEIEAFINRMDFGYSIKHLLVEETYALIVYEYTEE